MAGQLALNLLDMQDVGDKPDRDYMGPRTGAHEFERERRRLELEESLQRADPRILQDVIELYQGIAPPPHVPDRQGARSNDSPNPDTTARRGFPMEVGDLDAVGEPTNEKVFTNTGFVATEVETASDITLSGSNIANIAGRTQSAQANASSLLTDCPCRVQGATSTVWDTIRKPC